MGMTSKIRMLATAADEDGDMASDEEEHDESFKGVDPRWRQMASPMRTILQRYLRLSATGFLAQITKTQLSGIRVRVIKDMNAIAIYTIVKETGGIMPVPSTKASMQFIGQVYAMVVNRLKGAHLHEQYAFGGFYVSPRTSSQIELGVIFHRG